MVASFPDSRVYAVRAGKPAVVTDRVEGLYPFEHDNAGTWWRWMGRQSEWTIENLTGGTRLASLVLRARAADAPRTMTITLDHAAAGQVEVGTEESDIELPALVLTAGAHTIVLTAIGEILSPAARGRSSDTRELSVMLTSASWTDLGASPAAARGR